MAVITVSLAEVARVKDRPDLESKRPEHYMSKVSFEPLPFRAGGLSGKVVCEGYAIDGLRAYGYCKLVDSKGREHTFTGWSVDLDPTKESFWQPWYYSHMWPAKYEFCFDRESLEVLKVELPGDLKKSFDEAAEKVRRGEGRYVCLRGYAYNPRVFYAEQKYSPIVKKAEELSKKYFGV